MFQAKLPQSILISTALHLVLAVVFFSLSTLSSNPEPKILEILVLNYSAQDQQKPNSDQAPPTLEAAVTTPDLQPSSEVDAKVEVKKESGLAKIDLTPKSFAVDSIGKNLSAKNENAPVSEKPAAKLQKSASAETSGPPVLTNEVKFDELKNFGSNEVEYKSILAYQRLLIAQVKRFWKPVRSIKVKNDVIVSVYFEASGRMIKYELTQSSTNALLDTQAINTVKNAGPYPPLPDSIPADKILVVPFKFKNELVYF